MSTVLQNSTEETRVVLGLWMMVIFSVISPFPSCPAQAGVRQPKPWTWGSAEPWELAGLAEKVMAWLLQGTHVSLGTAC